MKIISAVALLGSTALVTSSAFAQQAQQQPSAGPECAQLVQYLEKRPEQKELPVTLEQARKHQQANDEQACREASQRLAKAGHDVKQTQARPAQSGEQTGAQVRVQQQAPQVSVRQPMPEIIVRQAPPTITIDQPQPEIIVRMPQPEVDVATAPPQVEVQQAKPQVQVTQPEQRQVQVQQEGQPQVRYERMGEPNVQFRQADGQPQVRYEQAAPGQQQGTQQPTTQQQARQQPPSQQPTQAQPQPAPQPGAAAAATTALTVERLERMNVYNARGNNLGSVDDVLVDGNRQYHVVVSFGGFLGIGERKVLLPLDRVQLQGDRLLIPGLTDDQLKQMPAYREQPGFQPVDGNQQINVAVAGGAGATTGQRR
jgi:sporulation protein YlmC with PRC-barrel domain